MSLDFLLFALLSIACCAAREIAGGCGVRPEVGTRIIGGQTSFPGRWPWMAALYRGKNQYCAGALISDRHILTAAHCVSGFRPQMIRVRIGDFDLGSQNFSSDASGNSDNYYGISKMVIHKSYEARSHVHDIAVIRLDRIVPFSPFIQRICLPPPTDVSFEDRTAVVAGWGTIAFLGSSSPWLREVEVPIWNNDACFNVLKKYVYNTTLCAGNKEKSADACQGDSGGPLMLQMGDGRWAAIGVVSWGIRCGEPNKPGVYTRTSQYTEWILNAVRSTN